MTFLKTLFPGFLIVIIALIGCAKDNYNFNDLPPTVKSYFTTTATKYNINEEVQLKNESKDADSYSWDFGDSTTSTEKDPKKIFTKPGSFTIKLKAVGAGGTGNYSKTLTIIDPNAVVESNRDLFFIEYNNPTRAIRKISLKSGSVAETVLSLTGRAGVGLAYDSVGKKIYFTDFINTNAGKVWRVNLDGSGLQELASGITDPYSIAVNIKGGKIYWADNAGNISKSNLDGSGFVKDFIHVNSGQMRGVSYNSKTDMIYFYEVNNEDLYAAKSDGTGVSKIIEGAYGYGIFVDEENSKLYFENRNEPAIMRANLDGSGIVKIVSVPGTRVYGMAIDYSVNKFYWSDMSNNTIKRSNLDGTKIETVLTGLNSPRGLFIK